MKKFFPLCLIVILLCWSVANADISGLRQNNLNLTTNVDPAGGTVITNDDSGRPVYMSSPNNFPSLSNSIGSEYKADKPAYDGTKNVPDPNVILQGGDNCANATVIPSLPYSNSGTTVGYTDDYDMVCPYSGSTSPDVVYSFTPSANITVNIDICESAYDTKLFIFENNCTIADSVACNDDNCSNGAGDPYRSSLSNVAMNTGSTYYIVVDGYGGESGTYNINVTEAGALCDLICPPNGIPEGETPCHDEYTDTTNVGCNAVAPALPVFTPISIGDTVCGTSGTFTVAGVSNRDTDWYRLVLASDATLTWSAVAEFDLLLFIIDAGSEDCVDYTILTNDSGPACSTVTVSAPVTAGVYYLWVGPSVFSGWPCGSDYIATVNIAGVPTGACCVNDICVATNTSAECAALQGDWYIGEDCANFICPLPCVVVCPPGSTPEGEVDCYDEYSDTTNTGCNAVAPILPAFTPISDGDTICGTAGTFTVGGLDNRDTDWYRIVVAADGMLTWSGVAEFDFLMFIIDAGSEDCVDYTILTNATALPCSTLILSAPVSAGVYYLWAGPSEFTGVPCGSQYFATVELAGPPTGACCVGEVCVATNTISECDALQGDWFIGEDCGTFECNALSLTCAPSALFGQEPTPPEGGWTIANSEGPDYRVFDDFTGVADSIGDIHWWGSPLVNIGGWAACTENPMDFTIGFYPDLGGIPDTANPTCFYNVTVTGVPTGRVYAGFALEYYYSTTINPCCDISNGWVSIVGYGDPDCWFLWMSSGETGQGFAYQEASGVLNPTDYDLSFCLTPCGGGGGGCDYAVGDVNGSDTYNGLDITYGVAFFKGGAAPLCDPNCPPCAGWNYCGDVNGSCSYNGLDITYGVAYFKGGAGPIPCADCPPAP